MISLIAGIAVILAAVATMRRDIRRIGCAYALMAGILMIVHGAFSTLRTFAPTAYPVGADSSLSSSVQLLSVTVYAAYALLVVMGCFLIANGILFSVRFGATAARLRPVPFGIVCLIPAFCLSAQLPGPPDIAALTPLLQSDPLLRFIVDLTLFIPFVLAAYTLYSLFYARTPKRGPFDYLIVLGAGLRGTQPTLLLAYRLEAALHVYSDSDPRPIVVVSGGKGADEAISEAQAMRDYLVGRGMPSESIVMEDRSTSTKQNLIFSKKLMDTRGGTYTGCIVTSNFHALRAAIAARRCGLDFQCIGCKTKRTYLPAAAMRETAAFAFEYKGFAALYAALAAATIALQLLAPGFTALL